MKVRPPKLTKKQRKLALQKIRRQAILNGTLRTMTNMCNPARY